MKKLLLLLWILLVPAVISAMDSKKKLGKFHAQCLKKFKQEISKKEEERMLKILLAITNVFTTAELNNTPYEKLVKESFDLLVKYRLKKTIFMGNKKEEDVDMPLNPEQLVIAAASNDKIPDFLLHAALVYAGTRYAKELIEHGHLINAFMFGKNATQQFALPMPRKKLIFKIPDGIAGMPIFDKGGIFVAVLGKKCISIFNTGSQSEQPQYKFKKLEEANIQLTSLDLDQDTLLGRLPDGKIIKYLNIHKYTESDAIPDIEVIKKGDLFFPQNTSKALYLSLEPEQKNCCMTTTTNTYHVPNTPRPKKSANTNTIFTSLPENLLTSPLPPYINRFTAVKTVQSGLTYFLDLETNKSCADDDKSENTLDPHYALLNGSGTRGIANPNNKTFDCYSFVTMLPLFKWFLGFCLRYGKLATPIKLTAPWAVNSFASFSKDDQLYLMKTYNVLEPKKKLSQSAIPPLKLGKFKLFDKKEEKDEKDGSNSAR